MIAFVALGSNLGNSREILLRAMDRLEKFSSAPLLRSSLWGTEPIDCPPGVASFVNAMVGLTPPPHLKSIYPVLPITRQQLNAMPKPH